MEPEKAAAIEQAIEAAVATHAPGGMVGAFVFAGEMYGVDDGQPYLLTIRSHEHTTWTHLGMIDALKIDTEVPMRQVYEDDDDQ